MSPPTAEQQLEFLTNLQRLLSEGQFVATYKYALLLALAEIAIEQGDDSGNALQVSTRLIAEKFIQYYWRQCVPYLPRSHPAKSGQVLRQNTGKQAAIIRSVIQARGKYDGSLVIARHDAKEWKRLITNVASVVRQMPLWKLQTVGNAKLDFLYENRGKGTVIELRPGVVYCLRHFYNLIGDLVRGAWVRYIRRNNHDELGTTTDLSEFLFGSERADLGAVQSILRDIQWGKCFYCERGLRTGSDHVDHFVPWSKYPVDLGHNFVLAHDSCNSAKADHLAAADYLCKWAERNSTSGNELAEGFDRNQILHDLPTSVRVANWAYGQTFESSGMVWVRSKELMELSSGWEQSLAGLLDRANRT